jgi:hypothetical protein
MGVSSAGRQTGSQSMACLISQRHAGQALRASTSGN